MAYSLIIVGLERAAMPMLQIEIPPIPNKLCTLFDPLGYCGFSTLPRSPGNGKVNLPQYGCLARNPDTPCIFGRNRETGEILYSSISSGLIIRRTEHQIILYSFIRFSRRCWKEPTRARKPED
jgi:hypothetical protein